LIQQDAETLYEALCGALRKSLSEGGAVALTAALTDQPIELVAESMELLTPDETLAVVNWMDDARAFALLPLLDDERVKYVMAHVPAGRIAHFDAVPATPET
jgi:hypothetical protein